MKALFLSTTHTLKTEHDAWLAVRDGSKTAEFRRDDRGFKVGDLLRLKHGTDEATGLVLHRRITHIVRGPAFGIPEGYAMLSMIDPALAAAGTEKPDLGAAKHAAWCEVVAMDLLSTWERSDLFAAGFDAGAEAASAEPASGVLTDHAPAGAGTAPKLDPYYVKAIEHARLRILKEPRCAECTTTIEALNRLLGIGEPS